MVEIKKQPIAELPLDRRCLEPKNLRQHFNRLPACDRNRILVVAMEGIEPSITDLWGLRVTVTSTSQYKSKDKINNRQKRNINNHEMKKYYPVISCLILLYGLIYWATKHHDSFYAILCFFVTVCLCHFIHELLGK